VTRAVAERAGEVGAVYPRDADVPAWLMQTLRVQVHEEVVHTAGEFA